MNNLYEKAVKLKILKDIPGYKAGEILGKSEYSLGVNLCGKNGVNCHYSYEILIKDGWAEEVKEDEIDIEEIREKYFSINVYAPSIGSPEKSSDRDFYHAYLIVKAVTDQLNGTGKVDWKMDGFKYYIDFHHGIKSFGVTGQQYNQCQILPICKSEEIAKRVIDLCDPELKILFNVKE